MATKFSAQIKGKFTGPAKKALDNIVKGSEVEVFSRAILGTPVDKGRLRGNWNLNQAVVTGNLDKSGAITIERMTSGVLESEIGGITSLINALPYSETVELGGYSGVGPKTVAANGGIYSKQAPAGMVRIAAMKFPEIVETIAAKYRV